MLTPVAFILLPFAIMSVKLQKYFLCNLYNIFHFSGFTYQACVPIQIMFVIPIIIDFAFGANWIKQRNENWQKRREKETKMSPTWTQYHMAHSRLPFTLYVCNLPPQWWETWFPPPSSMNLLNCLTPVYPYRGFKNFNAYPHEKQLYQLVFDVLIYLCSTNWVGVATQNKS